MATRRRLSNPTDVQRFWDAIQVIEKLQEQATYERILKYIEKIYKDTEEYIDHQLRFCLKDGLLQCNKGKKAELDIYSIPTDLLQMKDCHDWYCFICHKSGDVILCTCCHRVFHLLCIPNTLIKDIEKGKEFTCTTCCKILSSTEPVEKKKELNTLLIYTCSRLKERLPLSLTNRQVPSISNFTGEVQAVVEENGTANIISWEVSGNDPWRTGFLWFYYMDVNLMEGKAKRFEYTCLDEFEADAATILHNVIIYHGAFNPVTDLIQQMYDDCVYDLNEITQCRDCYRRSNEKRNKNWFCKPCDPPHQLVFAKQKGYPYWPAKVIKIEGEKYDVRFFGEPHERAKLEEAYIKPIETEITALGIRRSALFRRAFEELKKHQELLSSEGNLPPQIQLPVSQRQTNKGNTNKRRSNSGDGGAKETKKTCKDSKSSSRINNNNNKSERKTNQNDSYQNNDTQQSIENNEGIVREEEIQEQNVQFNDQNNTANSPDIPVLLAEPDADNGPGPSFDAEDNPLLLNLLKTEKEDEVSSSSFEPRTKTIATQTTFRIPKSEPPTVKYKEEIDPETLEKLKSEWRKEDEELRKNTEEFHQRELSRLRATHQAELVRINEKFRYTVNEIKRKQWCNYCNREASLQCCWNTCYCSENCQLAHWHNGHKVSCRRRKR